MDTQFRPDLIKDYIRQLVPALGGVHTPVEPTKLRHLFDAKDYAGMLAEIQRTMRLHCKVQLIEEEYPPEFSKTKGAWVHIPRSLPSYDDSAFAQACILVCINKKSPFFPFPFECLVALMAHELAHIILRAIQHPLQYSEEATDLTAMILGYANFFTDCLDRPVFLRDSIKNRFRTFFYKLMRKSPQDFLAVGRLGPNGITFAATLILTHQEKYFHHL